MVSRTRAQPQFSELEAESASNATTDATTHAATASAEDKASDVGAMVILETADSSSPASHQPREQNGLPTARQFPAPSPPGLRPPAKATTLSTLPLGWAEACAPDGRTYYWRDNSDGGRTVQWQRPCEPAISPSSLTLSSTASSMEC